jgi:spermidine synthase
MSLSPDFRPSRFPLPLLDAVRSGAGLLYALVFIEGYVVLAAELIAIRQIVSYVGNGTDVISLIIAAVLLPLAFGYYAGGHDLAHRRKTTIRNRLSRNFRVALFFLTFGLSLLIVNTFFTTLSGGGVLDRITQTTLYAAIFLVFPVFCLGQTIPLISRYFRSVKTEKVAGRMLAASTLGSFLGSVFSTIVIMAYFGVHVAVLLALALLVLAIALTDRTLSLRSMTPPLVIFGIALLMNSNTVFDAVGVSYQNAYNTVRILEKDGERTLLLNEAASSGYNTKTGETFDYIRQAETLFIEPLRRFDTARDILVLGTGGFTFGLKDTINSYTYVDIDPDLKKMAEEEFLQKKLTPNKKFAPVSARAFLREAKEKNKSYDLIYIDAYNAEMFIPETLVTREFFGQVRAIAKPGGTVLANFVGTPMFRDPYTVNFDATFRNVFPNVMRIPVGDFDGWADDPRMILNILYAAPIPLEDAPQPRIYTDDRNPVYLDKRN